LKVLYIALFLWLITGCANKSNIEIKESISDLSYIPQDISYYTKNINDGYISDLDTYKNMYFHAWNIDKSNISLDKALWPYRAFKVGESYGENLQLYRQDFFDKVKSNSNFEAYSTLNKRALTLVELNIRAFPTSRPLLHDPKKAGEGFPFDYLQNSTISANKPIFISHYSKDKEWVFILSSFAYGWVKTRDIVFIDKKYTDIWQNIQQVFIIKEGIPIYSEDGYFLFKSKIGMMFPLIKEDKDSYSILTITNSKNTMPLYLKSKISKSISHKNILKFNAKNIQKIYKEISKTNYGWGGIYGQRDCSSTIRDFFAPFGLWLPRNSYQQSKIGKIISIENLSIEDKIKTIKAMAIPFKTLLYKKGHILIYAGIYDGKIVAFHNTWGIKTKKDGVEGRFIIGKMLFSTLNVGSNLKYFDKESSILKNLKSINILTQ
jgi:hypothetical protein